MSLHNIHPTRAGQILAAARTSAGLSRRELGERAGVSSNQIGHIERTEGAGWSTMVNLLDACGYDVVFRRRAACDRAAFDKAHAVAVMIAEISGSDVRVVAGPDGRPLLQFIAPVSVPAGGAK